MKITLQKAMQEASIRMAQHYASPQEINEGGCFDWSTEVIALVDCKIVARTYHGGYHCFIEYRKKFYDAEAPQGVKQWQALPYFKRCVV